MAVTTHSFKYKPTTAPSGTEDRVLACSHTTDDCHCVINSSGQIGYYVSGVFTQIGTATVSLNEQYSFIIEHDTSGNGCIYLNGQKIGCATNFPTTAINQIGNFKTELKPETGRKPKVGLKPRAVSNIYARPCCGVIDEYARFNRALSASEVVDLSQSGTLSKVYTLADYKIALMADDGIIATTEKPRYKENWRSIWNADQRTSALPTAIASITVNGSYKSLATSANDAGIWTPTTNGTPAYDYYQAVESWRQMFFVSSGGGTGFLLTANLAGDTDISAMSPTLESRQSALMFAEDALRSAVMIKRQSTAELTSVANANAYTDELEDALREQTDHAIVFTTSTSDPSTSWTAEEKLIHKGDYWRADPSSAWKTWTGTTWGTVNDAQAQAAASAAASAASTAQSSANAAQATANEKRRVFNSTPTVPYDIGDLWVAGSSGDIKKCNTQRLTGSYTASDWSIASKYTDDSTANQKSRTFIQTTAPTSGVNAGDYWLDSDDGHKPYVYKDGAWSVDSAMQSAINAGTAAGNAQAAANLAASAASTAQSTANAKRRVFTATPTAPYDVGDLWVAGTSGDIKKCKTARVTGAYLALEWELASKYTDDTTANTKSKTFIQATAPTTGMRVGDYWLDSDDGHKPYVYKDGAWSVDSAMQSAINAGTAAGNAQAAANLAASAASSAQGDATNAINAITNITSDNVLSSAEKPEQRKQWNIILAEKAGILAQATTFGVSSTSYSSAFQLLANYLNAGVVWTSGAPSWISDANLSTNTTIVGSTYRSNWEALYTARTALLNAISVAAKTLADNAKDTASSKTTLYGTLASAKLAAKSGDQFFYNSEIYVCTAALAATARRYTTKSYGNSATAPVQTAQTISGCVLTEPLNYGDTYFNTTTKKFYTYTTSWVEDTATSNSVIAYAPKYLGRYYQSHPGSPNNGDWWLVYGLASSPITRGFWYNNNGTNTLVSTLGTEAQRKYKGSGLEDVLYASNNGYALTSGGVYDPVGIYGVSTMEFLAVNQAFIEKLMTRELELQSGGKLFSGTGSFNNSNTPIFLGYDGATAKFSLSDKLSFDGANLNITGRVVSHSGIGTQDSPVDGDVQVYIDNGQWFSRRYNSGSWINVSYTRNTSTYEQHSYYDDAAIVSKAFLTNRFVCKDLNWRDTGIVIRKGQVWDVNVTGENVWGTNRAGYVEKFTIGSPYDGHIIAGRTYASTGSPDPTKILNVTDYSTIHIRSGDESTQFYYPYAIFDFICHSVIEDSDIGWSLTPAGTFEQII